MAFSADWLGLREVADNNARDSELLKAAAKAAGADPVILDLGCGTGSNIRALSTVLPETTQWHLVDNDPELLKLAGTSARGFFSLHCQDIQNLADLPLGDITLVTASALIDLVSRQWLQELATMLRVPVYFALSYDGAMDWNPGDPRDVLITDAFNRHQRGDKGLGPALGPDSVAVATDVFSTSGFQVTVAKSPWNLTGGDTTLQNELVSGIAEAAFEMGYADASSWRQMRITQSEKTHCVIGHGDILAIPKTLERQSSSAFS